MRDEQIHIVVLGAAPTRSAADATHGGVGMREIKSVRPCEER